MSVPSIQLQAPSVDCTEVSGSRVIFSVLWQGVVCQAIVRFISAAEATDAASAWTHGDVLFQHSRSKSNTLEAEFQPSDGFRFFLMPVYSPLTCKAF